MASLDDAMAGSAMDAGKGRRVKVAALLNQQLARSGCVVDQLAGTGMFYFRKTERRFAHVA